MLHRLVEILTDGAACHHIAQYRIYLHLHVSLDSGNLITRLIAFDDLAVAPNKKLGEVPLDVAATTLRFQPSIERMRVLTIHLNLVELWEVDIVVGCTELVNLLNSAWCLLAELVAGEIENLEALALILLIERFQVFILRRESAAGCRVYYQQHLVLVLGERHVLAPIVLHREIINTLCR